MRAVAVPRVHVCARVCVCVCVLLLARYQTFPHDAGAPFARGLDTRCARGSVSVSPDLPHHIAPSRRSGLCLLHLEGEGHELHSVALVELCGWARRKRASCLARTGGGHTRTMGRRLTVLELHPVQAQRVQHGGERLHHHEHAERDGDPDREAHCAGEQRPARHGRRQSAREREREGGRGGRVTRGALAQ
jgi:hypothetical protein